MRFRHGMMAMLLAVAAMGSTGCVVTVHEGSYGGDHYRRDGWVKLGERMVNGQVDRDAILVGGSEGRFRRVVIVVENSSLEMYDMDIEFSNGTHFSPRLKRRFAEGARSQVIDLPGDLRTIRKVTLKYGNLPGGGAASVALYGK